MGILVLSLIRGYVIGCYSWLSMMTVQTYGSSVGMRVGMWVVTFIVLLWVANRLPRNLKYALTRTAVQRYVLIPIGVGLGVGTIALAWSFPHVPTSRSAILIFGELVVGALTAAVLLDFMSRRFRRQARKSGGS